MDNQIREKIHFPFPSFFFLHFFVFIFFPCIFKVQTKPKIIEHMYASVSKQTYPLFCVTLGAKLGNAQEE